MSGVVSFYCPRRDDMTRSMAAWTGAAPGLSLYFDPEVQIGATPLTDTWRGSNDEVHGISCSYCGSMRPEDFLAAVKAGAEIGPTDKAYKVYVTVPELHPDWLRVVEGRFGGDDAKPAGEGWYRHDSKPIRDAEKRSGYGHTPGHGEGWSKLGPRGANRHLKFYLQHIAHPGPLRAELYDLVTAEHVTIGYPGHFYSGLVGMRLEHLARHPEAMNDAERAALDAFRTRNPEVAAP